VESDHFLWRGLAVFDDRGRFLLWTGGDIFFDPHHDPHPFDGLMTIGEAWISDPGELEVPRLKVAEIVEIDRDGAILKGISDAGRQFFEWRIGSRAQAFENLEGPATNGEES
jgi:hypothetical protein